MFAKKILAVSAVFAFTCGFLTGCMEIVRPLEAGDLPYVSIEPSEPVYNLTGLTGVRLFGVSDAPYTSHTIEFEALNQATYKYFDYDKAQDIPVFLPGDTAEGWKSLASGDRITESDCRNLVVASVDENNIIEKVKTFLYITGINYYPLENSVQTDSTQNPPVDTVYRSPAAAGLAQTLLNTQKADYTYGMGRTLYNYLEQYNAPEAMKDTYNAGLSLAVIDGQPIYAPIGGQIIAIGDANSMNQIILYNKVYDMSLIMLHAKDISAAKTMMDAQQEVKPGDLLGYGGRVGEPVGYEQIHMELLSGKATSYKYATKDLATLRKTSYDPRILSELIAQPIQDNNKPTAVFLGNTDGNVNGKGMVARLDNYIVFVNDSTGGQMYKTPIDGSEMTLITTDKCTSLAASEGWIYYSNLSDKGNLYKIRPDGTQKTMVFGNNSDYITVVNDLIYFRNFSQKSFLYIVKTDGTQPTRLNKSLSWMYTWGGDKLYISYGSDRIFSVVPTLETPETPSVMTQIGTEKAWYLVTIGDWIYYSNGSRQNTIYKMKKDGTENQQVHKEGAEFLNYHDGWLYFVSLKEQQRIYRIDPLDPTKREQVNDDPFSSDINIIGHWLYYRVGKRNQYRKNLNTGEITKVETPKQ